MASTDDTTETDVLSADSDTDSELEALRAERDALAAELKASSRSGRWLKRFRGLLSVIGVILSCILVLGAAVGVWAQRSFLDTDGFVERAGGLVDEPEVRSSLSTFLSNEINELIDAESVIRDALEGEDLPEAAGLLAVPLSGAIEEFIADQVTAFVNSETFADLWKGAVEVAHGTAADLLAGDSEIIESGDDRVVINFLPVINSVLAEITSLSPEIFGNTVELPDIAVEDVPEEAVAALSDALGVEIDEDFGTFTIYDEGALSTAQQAVKLADQVVWLLVVAAPLMILATLALSPRRRRTIIQLGVGITVTMVLLRRLVLIFQEDLLELVQKQENLGAVDVTASTFLDPLFDGALTIGIVALVVVVVAFITGPYKRAVQLRRGTVEAGRSLADAASTRAEDENTQRWIAEHREPLQYGGLAVGVVLLWWIDLSWLAFLLLAAFIGGYELLVSRLADQGEALDGGAGDGEGGDDDPSDDDADTEADDGGEKAAVGAEAEDASD